MFLRPSIGLFPCKFDSPIKLFFILANEYILVCKDFLLFFDWRVAGCFYGISFSIWNLRLTFIRLMV